MYAVKLFVDDSRNFPQVGYECCRDAETAKRLLSFMRFELVSLDYSLGTNCETGLDILIWMKDNNISVPSINIHSNHVVGREKMRSFAEENFPDSEITANILPK